MQGTLARTFTHTHTHSQTHAHTQTPTTHATHLLLLLHPPSPFPPSAEQKQTVPTKCFIEPWIVHRLGVITHFLVPVFFLFAC